MEDFLEKIFKDRRWLSNQGNGFLNDVEIHFGTLSFKYLHIWNIRNSQYNTTLIIQENPLTLLGFPIIESKILPLNYVALVKKSEGVAFKWYRLGEWTGEPKEISVNL